MKRIGVLLASAFLGSVIAGCESGLKEGSPSEPVTTAVTNEFKAAMEKAGPKMTKKQMGKGQMPKQSSAPETKSP